MFANTFLRPAAQKRSRSGFE